MIVRMARENSRWGYLRIRGELLKLGYMVSATTIRSVLKHARVPPARHRSQLTWKQFLAAHAETLVATDFFSVDTVFLRRLSVLVFVHLSTRRMLATACTAEPSGEWVTQQARNLSWQLEEEGIRPTIVVHDRDRKFAGSFDRVFQSVGARVVLTPLMAPRANAHVERWIGSCRRESLDWMLIASESHLRKCSKSTGEHYNGEHYNNERPHRSRDSVLRRPVATPRVGERETPLTGGSASEVCCPTTPPTYLRPDVGD